ncbi:MAG: conjugal transfer protein TraN [Rubrivivax sp.]|nr:conjugal transfer protein TraN [Rubrivivax sp.]
MLDTTACTALTNNRDCVLRDSVCTDTADKLYFGFRFSRPCWSTTQTYTCPTAATSTCQPLVDAGCSVIPTQTQCTSYLPSGACDVTTYYYECGSPITVTEVTQTCDGVPYCINGVCYDRSRPSDPDFGRSVAMMEAAREGGNYIDAATFTIFKGEADFCTRRLLVNCCKGNGGPGVNLTNQSIYTAFDFGRTFAGSMYTYDALFASSAPDFLVSGLESLGATSAVGANTFSAYGVTLGWGPSGFQIVAFDPATFAAMVVVQIVITELMSCEDADKQTAVKKDQGICQHMGSWCSSKVLGSCMEHREGYCCFNSKLAKAVSMQGKRQLGITWGSPQQPNCTGLTIDQINSLDFSQIDLSEFIASISANAIGDADAVGRAITRLTNPNVPPGAPPIPTGGPVPGAPPPPPPPEFPPTPPDASVTASFAPATVSYGNNFTLTTDTVGANTLTYTCAGAFSASGALGTGLTNTIWLAQQAHLGVTKCTFQASGPYTTYSTEATLTVIPPVPTVAASFAPEVVSGGKPFSMTTTTANAVSLDYSCTGSMPMSGSIATGSAVTPLVASVTNMGLTNCVFTARDAIGGMTISNASFTVAPVTPMLTATFVAPTINVGQTTTLTTNATDAISLDYVCTGAMAGAGSRPIGTSSTAILGTNSNIGLTTCTFTARSATNTPAQVVVQVQVNP